MKCILLISCLDGKNRFTATIQGLQTRKESQQRGEIGFVLTGNTRQVKRMNDDRKVWHAGKARQEELDDIDQCRLCEIMPELEQTCYATEYCHRQLKMEVIT